MSDPADRPELRTTRREMLRKTVIVGGMAWTMPLINTTTARADGVGSPPPCGQPGEDCLDNSKCCSGNCGPDHRCIGCFASGTSCTSSAQCCSGLCVTGLCA